MNQGHSGRYITFQELTSELYKSMADHSEKRVIGKYSKIKCLVIDEHGYIEPDKAAAGLFFTLMQQRYKKTCTIITTNLGFKEWDTFLHNSHLTMALVDRLTDNGHIINMKKCQSIREDAEVD
ncbi:MAG: ATP-binding protein [Oligoflexia bacterium]|nr:ATP-binding protein [Oligoflexia bacterium]